MGFSDAVKSGFKHYVNFHGRASRSEFWYFRLFQVLVIAALFVLGALIGVVGGDSGDAGAVGAGLAFSLMGLFYLATFLPELAVAVRRLHDTNKSGFWLLIAFVPFGGIVLLVFFVTGGDHGPNQHGPNPLRPSADQSKVAQTFE